MSYLLMFSDEELCKRLFEMTQQLPPNVGAAVQNPNPDFGEQLNAFSRDIDKQINALGIIQSNVKNIRDHVSRRKQTQATTSMRAVIDDVFTERGIC